MVSPESPSIPGVNEDRSRPAPPPKHGAGLPSDLFEQGIGWGIVARFKSGGPRVEAGIFLVDVPCLGVKQAVCKDTAADDYRRRIRDLPERWTT